jgi:hypothetical protein
MSRYADYSEDCEVPPEFWDNNVRRALKGRRGRKMLAEMRDALMALPEHRLIRGALCTVGASERAAANPRGYLAGELAENVGENGCEGVCAIGAWLWHKRVLGGMDPAEAFASLPELVDATLSDTATQATYAGATFTLAWELASLNDESHRGDTPEQRWQRFIDWIDGELGEVAA